MREFWTGPAVPGLCTKHEGLCQGFSWRFVPDFFHRIRENMAPKSATDLWQLKHQSARQFRSAKTGSEPLFVSLAWRALFRCVVEVVLLLMVYQHPCYLLTMLRMLFSKGSNQVSRDYPRGRESDKSLKVVEDECQSSPETNHNREQRSYF